MIKTKISNQIMHKIVAYEKKTTTWWAGKFLLLIVTITGLFLFFLSESLQRLNEWGSTDLLTLFGEDREIIQEYWQDTLWLFWEEAPQEKMVTSALILLFLITIIFLLRKKIWYTIKKISILTNYSNLNKYHDKQK